MSKPKYCPFCGSTEIECHSIHSRFCHGCGVTCIWYGNLRDIDTEAAWNRRAELLPERDAEREKAVDINEIQRRKDAAYERGETIYNHALLRQPRVPPGYALMPVEPTAAMRLAMAKADVESGDRYRFMATALIRAAQEERP